MAVWVAVWIVLLQLAPVPAQDHAAQYIDGAAAIEYTHGHPLCLSRCLDSRMDGHFFYPIDR